MTNSFCIKKFATDTFKMLKYQVKASTSLLVILAVMTLLNTPFILGIESGRNDAFVFFSFLITSICFVGYCCLFVFSFVSSFYRDVFGKHAYLTHSLPVSVDSILLARILACLLWTIVAILEMFYFALVIGGFDGLESMGKVIGGILSEPPVIFYILSSCFEQLMLLLMVIALVHYRKTYVFFCGVLDYIGFCISRVLLGELLFPYDNLFKGHGYGDYAFTSSCISVILGIVYYAVCRHIIKYRLAI